MLWKTSFFVIITLSFLIDAKCKQIESSDSFFNNSLTLVYQEKLYSSEYIQPRKDTLVFIRSTSPVDTAFFMQIGNLCRFVTSDKYFTLSLKSGQLDSNIGSKFSITTYDFLNYYLKSDFLVSRYSINNVKFTSKDTQTFTNTFKIEIKEGAYSYPKATIKIFDGIVFSASLDFDTSNVYFQHVYHWDLVNIIQFNNNTEAFRHFNRLVENYQAKDKSSTKNVDISEILDWSRIVSNLYNSSGNAYSRNDTSKYLMIYLWYKGCFPCRLMKPEIDNILKDCNNVEIIAVNPIDKDYIDVMNFAQINGYQMKILFPSTLIKNDFARLAYPTVVLLDKNLKEIFLIRGYSEDNVNRLRERLDLLKN